jgi:hypothetical protein
MELWVGFEVGDDVEFPFRAQNLESLKSGASGNPCKKSSASSTSAFLSSLSFFNSFKLPRCFRYASNFYSIVMSGKGIP